MKWITSIARYFKPASSNMTHTTPSQTSAILTPTRLATLASAPHLAHSWYYIAAAAFAICNQSKEIPKIFHLALSLTLTQQLKSSPTNTDVSIETAAKAIKQAELAIELLTNGTPPASFESLQSSLSTSSSLLSSSSKPKAPLVTSQRDTAAKEQQRRIAAQIREALLKGAALGGLPRAINALSILKSATPIDLRAASEPLRPQENLTHEEETARGLEFWDVVYGKVARRIKGQMDTSYPDLLQWTLQHVYGPLLSYTGVLGASQSSLVVVACLVPQDVNPQLKGHLRGAVNNGALLDEVRGARDLAVEISQWCDMKLSEPVAKL